jgi:hypothetical protein
MEAEEKKEQPKSFSLKTSEAFLKGSLFLLFGPKKSPEGKRPIPPIYLVGGVIILLIFLLIIKKITAKPAPLYPPRTYPYEGQQPAPMRQPPLPGGY